MGTFSLKAVHAELSRTGCKVLRFAEVPTPPEAVAEGQVIPCPSLVHALTALRQRLGAGPRDVAVAIPASLALVRRLVMPKMPPKRLRALLEAQGQQFIPFYRDGAAFDFVVTNPDRSANEQEILLVAVPTVIVDRLRAVLRAASLRLVSLDIDIVALYRAGLALGQIPAGAPAVVLDIGHRRARLGLFNNGWPAIARTLDYLPLLPASAEQAEEVRFLSPDEFSVEVRRTAEIMLSQSRPDDALSAALLSMRSESPELAAQLEQEMKDGGHTAPEFRVVTAGGGHTVTAGFSLALGLSLAHVAPPMRLALLPRVSMDVVQQRRLAIIIFAFSLLASGAYGWFWHQKSLELADRRTALVKAIAAHNAYLSETEPKVKAVEARAKDFEPLRTALNTAEPWSVFYPHLRSLLPAGVVLETVNVSGQNLSLSGKVATPEGLADFVQRLHTSPMVAPPILHTYSEAAGTFNLTAKLNPRGR
ncbi:MAG TPA: pilus assembly protein PilM [Symbiobacteriaceae bacterium]|nr:pilus assembly protein PilM [Symbiobacteriaceae bacterium]